MCADVPDDLAVHLGHEPHRVLSPWPRERLLEELDQPIGRWNPKGLRIKLDVVLGDLDPVPGGLAASLARAGRMTMGSIAEHSSCRLPIVGHRFRP
jgi:hypothetical protein